MAAPRRARVTASRRHRPRGPPARRVVGRQRQRVLIAQGLAQQSDLLLLDEPTTGLDPEARERITTLLTALVADGTTVVQATHDLEAARSADACPLLSHGRLVADGPPAEVLTPQALSRIWQPA
ncbi:ferric citrate transport system ATP-binding protein [Streptomyces griseoflavus Tu4000]|uniref:Ferric citrate transport system ATP-binding protein n=1 Tax=Streptomyces griseoflavus Tu4000 TaxID=467200 RepID=D9XRL0_9ACTN|nr:ferric citrate transport system ATP-binding protein [Streptomyces griseoflavus Tu4000]